MDEARFGQQGQLTRIQAKQGARPRAVCDHRYTKAWLFGAVWPEHAVVLPGAHGGARTIHLAEISRCASAGALVFLVLDGAGWHISLLPLLRCPPKLNPVENVRESLRQNLLRHRVRDS